MSILESTRKMTTNEKMCYDMGYAQGKQDTVPVVRGEWEIAIGYDPNKKVQCQNCYKMAYEPTPYCPNCGAKMDLNREEAEAALEKMQKEEA